MFGQYGIGMLINMPLAFIIAPIFNDQLLVLVAHLFVVTGLPGKLMDNEQQEYCEYRKRVEGEC